MLIPGLQSTTIWKAFLLNSVAATVIVFTAVFIKSHFNSFVDIYGNKVENIDQGGNMIATLIVTFMSAIITYGLLFYVFGFGYGMLKCDPCPIKNQ
jgi:hypothetical protein